MRLLRLIVVMAVILVMALCVQENAKNLCSMTVFGHSLFTNIATPIVVFVALLAGVILGFPLAVFFQSVRARQKKAQGEEADASCRKKQDAAPEPKESENGEHSGSGYPLNGGS